MPTPTPTPTSRLSLLAFTFALLAAPAGALADPAAPAGWKVEASAGRARYAPAGRDDVELRLHAGEASSQSPEDWFTARRRRAPDGVAVAGYAETQQTQGVHIAIGAGQRARTPVIVVALGCRRADAAMIYGELVAPQDLGTLKQYLEPAVRVVVEACFVPGRGGAPAPKAEQDAKAGKAAKTAEPFAYRAAPGKGLAASSIEAAVYSWEQVYLITGLQLREDAYLLLKSGAVRRGLPPVPAEDFDAAAEQRAEPKLWGTWKKQGGDYVVSFGGGRFAKPPGALVRQPARAGERLNATYEGWSSAQIPGGAGAWSHWSITLGEGGRFSRSSAGGAGGGGIGEGSVVTSTVWDDEGSASSVSGPNFGGGSSRRSGSSKSDREGTYRLDGYTLELRYDSGRVERRFFYTQADRQSIWFGGGEMSVRKRK